MRYELVLFKNNSEEVVSFTINGKETTKVGLNFLDVMTTNFENEAELLRFLKRSGYDTSDVTRVRIRYVYDKKDITLDVCYMEDAMFSKEREKFEKLEKQYLEKEGISVNQNTNIASSIYAYKPGDGSAREQAASCQKVLGGWANIAKEYATKRYRSNLINWGMLPFVFKEEICFDNGDYLFVPNIIEAIKERKTSIKAYVVNKSMKEFELELGELTDDEREIILKGCLINYYKA